MNENTINTNTRDDNPEGDLIAAAFIAAMEEARADKPAIEEE